MNRKNRFHPYKTIKYKYPSNSNENDDEENDDNQLPTLMNLFTQTTNNPFRQLFGGDDTEVFSENNHIYFKTDVSRDSINRLCTLIRRKLQEYKNHESHNNLYNNVSPKPIYLHITSYGGSLYDAFIAYDYIKSSTVPIYTIVEGYAASAATIMSIAGIKRYITPTSVMLIHQLTTGMYGKYEELDEEIQNSKQDMNRIYDLYHRDCHGKMTKKEIIDELKHDRWWNANKCIQKGLCDEIYNIIN